MKKIISILLTVLMLVNMLAITAIPAAADTAVDLPANTAIVNLTATESDTTVVWQGTTYNVKLGTNYFATIQAAIEAADNGDTILLCAGAYTSDVYVSKSVTIKGAKAGVDPMKVYNAIKGGLAGSQVLNDKVPMIVERNFKPGGTIKVNNKDIKNVLDTVSILIILCGSSGVMVGENHPHPQYLC